MMRPLRIEFVLDGSGVHYNPAEPITLDGLLTAALCRWHRSGEPPGRDEIPLDIPLPLNRWRMSGEWGWKASALFPMDPKGEAIVFWRKRLRQNRIELSSGSPNTVMGTYRDWNMPLPLLLTTRMVAYAFGDAHEVRRELKRNIKHLGKKRAHGRGRILSIDVQACDEDLSCVNEGRAMRWLPSPNGFRLVRPRPPYWSTVGRVASCEIGEHLRPTSRGEEDGEKGWK
jgi:CRISPR type IV-associated protein Csf3